jgi:hypothetical protein
VKSVWQIAAGPLARSYVDVFLKYGVALIGPGDPGPWSPERSDQAFQGGFVRRFATEIAPGDVVVLRTGLKRIAAMGIVAGGYEYIKAFDDVNGWDLQHARRVRWVRLPDEHEFPSAVFGAPPPRCSRVWNEDVVDFAERFLNSPPFQWQEAQLPPLPAEEPPLTKVPESIAGLVAQARDLFPLMQDSQRFGDWPSEDEMIVHFVVPLLRAFGWRPECIGVKWRYVDVAVFNALPRTPESCRLVIEAKRLGEGVEGALEQAQGYVRALGAGCDVIVTDGIRYRLYNGSRGFECCAYANLAYLKQPAAELFASLQRP